MLADPAKRPELLRIASALRDAGVRVDIPLSASKMGAQLKLAGRIGAPYAAIIGAEYPAIQLKELATRETVTTDFEGLLELLSPEPADAAEDDEPEATCK